MSPVMTALRLAVLAVLVATPILAQGAPPFQPLPLLDGKQSNLRMRILKYTGGTNGEMTVEGSDRIKAILLSLTCG